MEEKNKDDVKKEENFDETKTEVFDSEEEVLEIGRASCRERV